VEHGDQDLSECRAVLDLGQGRVPEAAGLQPRLSALRALRMSAPSADPPILALRGLSKSFGGLTAVRDVTLELRAGDRQAIIGPNGAGKTTLFNLISGVLSASAGQVLLFGRDVTRWPSQRRAALGMARTFQVTSLFPKLSVLDNVLLALHGPRRTKYVMWRPLASYREDHETARRLLARAGFEDRAETEVRN